MEGKENTLEYFLPKLTYFYPPYSGEKWEGKACGEGNYKYAPLYPHVLNIVQLYIAALMIDHTFCIFRYF